MGENTKIGWADHTMNFWLGCQKVSPACDHCYAEDWANRFGQVRWGPGEDRRRTSAANWRQPFKWDAAAKAAGRIDFVFCLSLGDFWDNAADPRWRYDAIEVMENTPNLIYLILSKRIGNAIGMCDPTKGHRALPRNAALGATMVNQEEWNRDLPKLNEAGERLGARFTFASVEPMLGPIDARGSFPDWVIVGGESGPQAREFDLVWDRALEIQCYVAGIPYFRKQLGRRPVQSAAGAITTPYPLKDKKGEDWSEWPADMRVRQFPEGFGR